MGTQWTDVLLWKQFQSGDRSAFAKLVNQYKDVLYGYGKRFSADNELVRDCIQDIFLTIWHRREHLNEPSNIKFYLMKALRQRIVRQSTKWKKALSLNDISTDRPEFAIDLEHRIDSMEPVNSALKVYINKLTPRQREIIYLRFYENMKQNEIADLMGLNVQSIYNLQHSALIALKKWMDYKSIHDCLITLCLFAPTLF